MYVLKNEATPGIQYALKPNATYVVGRAAVDINCPTDQSVSRKHAEIVCKKENVIIKDLGSKYGTYVGEEAVVSSGRNSQEDRLTKGHSQDLKLGERVRFGLLSSVFILERAKFIFATSCLSKDETEIVKNAIKTLGKDFAIVQSSWSSEVTHVVLGESGTLSIKVVNALACGTYIVKSKFLQDLVRCLDSKQPLPDPCHSDYLPTLTESISSEWKDSLAPDKKRKSVFSGSTFAFANERQRSKYKDAIEYAGGSSIVLDKNFNPGVFKNPENILVNSASESDPRWKKAQEVVKSAKLFPIYEQHIPIAILAADCSMYCNPRVYTTLVFPTSKADAIQRHEPTIVSESESLFNTNSTQKSLPKEIPETASAKTLVSTKSVAEPSSSNTSIGNIENSGASSTPTNSSPSQSLLENSVDSDTRKENFRKPSVIPTTSNSIFRRCNTSVSSPKTNASTPNSKVSQPIEDLDEEDLFNFEDDGEDKKKSTSKRKRKPSNSAQNSKKVKIQGDLNVSPPKDSPKNPTQPQSLVNSPKCVTRGSYMSKSKTKPSFEVTKKNNCVTVSMPNKTPDGDQVSKDTTDASKVEHIDEKELTRSFVSLEVRPLVSNVSQNIQSDPSNSSSYGNTVNVKAFRKQGIAQPPTTVIDCNISFVPSLVIANNRENDSRSERNSTREASPEVITTPAAPRTSRRDANDEVEDLWKFDESRQSGRRKRKR